MADYKYKGHIAQIYEDTRWEDTIPSIRVTIKFQEFIMTGPWQWERDARKTRFSYIKHFERMVDKLNDSLK
jgi:hypothetical protein